MHIYSHTHIFHLLILTTPVLSTQIATFLDANCTEPLKTIKAQNGFPNGLCSNLKAQGPFASFKLLDLDLGCTATLYGKDSTTCSSQVRSVAYVARCYNTSWGRYSIDHCDRPGQVEMRPISMATSALTPSATASGQSIGAAHARTRAIADGVAGGVCACAIVAGVVCFFLRRRRRRLQGLSGMHASHEAPDAGLTELSPGEAKLELYAQVVRPQELGVNPVELEWKVISSAELHGGDIDQVK